MSCEKNVLCFTVLWGKEKNSSKAAFSRSFVAQCIFITTPFIQHPAKFHRLSSYCLFSLAFENSSHFDFKFCYRSIVAFCLCCPANWHQWWALGKDFFFKDSKKLNKGSLKYVCSLSNRKMIKLSGQQYKKKIALDANYQTEKGVAQKWPQMNFHKLSSDLTGNRMH